MNLNPQRWVSPLVAILVLVVIEQMTVGAIRSAGVWSERTRASRTRVEDPYARVEALLAEGTPAPTMPVLRNPFLSGPAPPPPQATRPGTRPNPRPTAPPRPQLTAILWDADPRALVRYDGRDYTVRENSLFADFRVTSITPSNVTLERNGSPIVLSLRPRGE